VQVRGPVELAEPWSVSTAMGVPFARRAQCERIGQVGEQNRAGRPEPCRQIDELQPDPHWRRQFRGETKLPPTGPRPLSVGRSLRPLCPSARLVWGEQDVGCLSQHRLLDE
jgi:hypothetical protein